MTAPRYRSEHLDVPAGEFATLRRQLATFDAIIPRLATLGVEDEIIDDFADLFAEFNRGAIETVLPVIPVLAATVNVAGRRTPAPAWER